MKNQLIVMSLIIIVSCNQKTQNVNSTESTKLYIYNFNDEVYVEVEITNSNNIYKGRIIGYYNGEDHGLFRYFSTIDNIKIVDSNISFYVPERQLTDEKIHLKTFKGTSIKKEKETGMVNGIQFNGKISNNKLVLSWISDDQFEGQNDKVFILQ